MTDRHAILVRLLDVEQRRAIERLVRPGESLSAALRRVLLAAANRMELDRPVLPQAERARRGAAARHGEPSRGLVGGGLGSPHDRDACDDDEGNEACLDCERDPCTCALDGLDLEDQLEVALGERARIEREVGGDLDKPID